MYIGVIQQLDKHTRLKYNSGSKRERGLWGDQSERGKLSDS